MAPSSQDRTIVPSIVSAFGSLLENENTPEAMQRALAEVGRAAQADRVYVFQVTERDGTHYASQRYEWSSRDVEPQIDNPELQNIPLCDAGYSRWLDELQQCRPIVGSVASFPSEEHHLLKDQGILSVAVLPIFADGALWGFIGFDDCTFGRDWTRRDVDILMTTAIAIGIGCYEELSGCVERSADTYLGLVRRLFDVQSMLFTDTPRESIIARTDVRLQVLSRSYQYFVLHKDASTISLPAYLEALRTLFTTVGSIDFQGVSSVGTASMHVDEIILPIDRALDVAIILTEILAVIAEHKRRELQGAKISVSFRRVEARVELTLTAWDDTGAPVGYGTKLDAMAVSLFRSLQEHFDATISIEGFDGLLFRLSFNITSNAAPSVR